MRLHPAAEQIIERLNRAGYEAYAVGGCVRDSLRGITPHDWDVTTNADPDQVTAVCRDWTVIPTGASHGTVTVLIDDTPIEVTTYRVDGEYDDHRHPAGVHFCGDLREDLARRDFTVNAMAYHPATGIVDPFGGLEDLRQGIIRCVGNPDRRFDEDALRILRALRFSSVLSFSIAPQTAAALHRLAPLLSAVSRERVYKELTALLCGNGVATVMTAYPDVLATVIPEIDAMRECPQNHPCHGEDVYTHTVRALAAIDPDPLLRWTMLFHDCGKPLCRTTDEDGTDHFFGHAKQSAALAVRRLTALKADRRTIDTVCLLVERHDLALPPTRPVIRRWLGRLGEENLRRLTAVHRADAAGCNPAVIEEKQIACDEWEQVFNAVLTEDAVVKREQLAVNGRDLMAGGIPAGPAIGQWLERLLEEVINDRLPNEKDALWAWIQQNTRP